MLVSRGDLGHITPFLQAMVQAGWDTHLALLSPWTHKIDGVQPHVCHPMAKSTPKLAAYPLAAFQLRRLVRSVRPDALWAHYASSAGLVAWLSGFRPWCVTIHGSDVLDVSQRWAGRELLRCMLPAAACVHAVSPQIAGRVENLSVSSDRILCLPFGIPVSSIEYHPPRLHDPPRLICTRNLQYDIHDVPTILHAVQQLKARRIDVHLTLAGKGRLQTELEQLAAHLSILDRVQFLGGYSGPELGPLLAQHDIYVSSTRSDGASLSLMEAMASGLYPVLADIPANRDWIKPACGQFFNVGQPDDLATAIDSAVAQLPSFAASSRDNRRRIELSADRSANMATILGRIASVALP